MQPLPLGRPQSWPSLCSPSCKSVWASSQRWWRCADLESGRAGGGVAEVRRGWVGGWGGVGGAVVDRPASFCRSPAAPPGRLPPGVFISCRARPIPPTHPNPPASQAGYNFLFGLWRYQWDADCELFLRIIMVRGKGGWWRGVGSRGRTNPPSPAVWHSVVTVASSPPPGLQGEVKEDVYVAQVRLQQEVEELFAAIDRAKGQATGFIAKVRTRLAGPGWGGKGGEARAVDAGNRGDTHFLLFPPLLTATGGPAYRLPVVL